MSAPQSTAVTLATNHHHLFRLETKSLCVRLEINLQEASSHDDRFVVRGTGADGAQHCQQSKTCRDDMVPGDDFVDLIFTRVQVGLSYSLEVDPGAGGDPYYVLEDAPWSELKELVR